MRIGLYGLPTAGKSFILNALKNLDVLSGSSLLKEIAPEFHLLTDKEKSDVRKKLALKLMDRDNFIMDGHYSFDDEIVFTNEDGKLYDTFLYLYIEPSVLQERMSHSIRNNKYLKFNIEQWQRFELESLRDYCHENNKDFYVLDNPKKGFFKDISMILEFIDSIMCGFSCVQYAKSISKSILNAISGNKVTLLDGDKTLILEDSCGLLGYKTNLFDGNFYTGFQSWRHTKEMTDYLSFINYSYQSIDDLDIHLNDRVINKIENPAVILTTGYYGIWKQLSEKQHMLVYYGHKISAETKFFVTKFLQKSGIMVTAFGDSMNDYYMLKQADKSFLVLKKDGTISSSLKGKNLEGIFIV